MAYTVHDGMTDNAADDIHKVVAGDRAKVTLIASAHTHTATETRDWLYETLVAAYMRRDNELLHDILKTIIDFQGWGAGAGAAAVTAEAGS